MSLMNQLTGIQPAGTMGISQRSIVTDKVIVSTIACGSNRIKTA